MQNNFITIKISESFGLYPGARYRSDGPFSGQQFYEDILKPNLLEVWNKSDAKLLIDFDGTFGYASSFISEVFIRVVKDFHDKKKIIKKIKFKSEDDPLLIDSILQTIDKADVG